MRAESSSPLERWELSDERASRPARVPGTVADALRAAGEEIPSDLDAGDWIFRTDFEGDEGETVTLRFEGIATHCTVSLNGAEILSSDSMFRAHDVQVTLQNRNTLEIHCFPLVLERRKPRARWRTKVADNALRFHRTSLLGRAPGFAPGPAPVGPWRPVSVVRGAGQVLSIRSRLEGDDGIVSVRGDLAADAEVVEIELGGTRTTLALTGSSFSGRARIASPRRWWPHTHGDPTLHPLRLFADGELVCERRVGFRSLAPELPIRINDVAVFVRGAIWIPGPGDLREQLVEIAGCGMNMLRVFGVGAYESGEFHRLCDELGILVWQDFMFANFDYPLEDEAFRASVEEEIRQRLAVLGSSPSLAVLCGGSEVEQQVAMLGLDPALGRGELYRELIPELIEEADVDAIYVPSSPSGGDLPFFPRTGVAHYFGVGAYRRPLEDARRADVRFAAECLAFANVPGDETVALLGPAVERGKVGVPRDVDADWDFEDVRDHYLELLFAVDPDELRRRDPDRYLELSRATTGEVMSEVFGEWRRAGSNCGGGLVLWLRDLEPGSGWGVREADGSPKVCWHHLRRILAPVAVWTTDEGLNGIDLHVANDAPTALEAELRVAFYAHRGHTIAEASQTLSLPPHTTVTRNAEAMLGRFVDASSAYRFGPPAHEAVAATLSANGGVLSRSFRFPAGRPAPVPPGDLGLRATATSLDDRVLVRLTTERLAYGVRIRARGWRADDDSLTIEPRGERTVSLVPVDRRATPFAGVVSALNLTGLEPVSVAAT